MEIIFKQSNSDNFQNSNRKKTDIKYIVIHYTGNYGDTAKDNAVFFAREKVGVSAHYFVDENNVYQSVKDEDIAWHCGTTGKYYHTYCRNKNSIGIEICMLDKNSNLRLNSINRAIQLTKYLMDKYNVDISHVLRHYDVTHKNCPKPFVDNPVLWTSFKTALKSTTTTKTIETDEEELTQDQFNKMMDTYLDTLANQQPESWSAEGRQWAEANGIIKGDENGKKEYKSFMTREMFVTMLERAFNK